VGHTALHASVVERARGGGDVGGEAGHAHGHVDVLGDEATGGRDAVLDDLDKAGLLLAVQCQQEIVECKAVQRVASHDILEGLQALPRADVDGGEGDQLHAIFGHYAPSSRHTGSGKA
jgi:hypothetical protein